MSDIVSVGSPIEGGISVDLDEVRATPPADQWRHTDLLCGVIAYLRGELATTTGDLAVACEVARERAEARPADYSPVHLYPETPSPRSPLCGSAGSGRMVARTEGELRGICVACVDTALAGVRAATRGSSLADRLAAAATTFLDAWRRGDDETSAVDEASDLEDAIAEWGDGVDAHRSVSATNPDGFVAEQIAETTGLLRSLWLEHHVTVMKLGGPVSDPTATFDAWLAAVSGGGYR